MKKVGKSKLNLETTTIRVLSGASLAHVGGAAKGTDPSYGERTCHTGSGCSKCDKCWTFPETTDVSCVTCTDCLP